MLDVGGTFRDTGKARVDRVPSGLNRTASQGPVPLYGLPPTPDSLVNKAALRSPASSSRPTPRSSAPTHS
eukprot:2846747-Prymnesium_polylepis.1